MHQVIEFVGDVGLKFYLFLPSLDIIGTEKLDSRSCHLYPIQIYPLSPYLPYKSVSGP